MDEKTKKPRSKAGEKSGKSSKKVPSKPNKDVNEVKVSKVAKSKSKTKTVTSVPSSSSSDSESNGFDVKYSFSQKSFKDIFADVGSIRRGRNPTTEELLEMYKDNPLLQVGSGIKSVNSVSGNRNNGLFHPNPKPKPKKAANTKSATATASTSKEKSAPTTLRVGFNYDPQPSSSNGRPKHMYPLDIPMTAEQMAVADLPTDTELDVEDLSPKKSKRKKQLKKVDSKSSSSCRGRPGRGKKIIVVEDVSSSCDEDPDDVNESFRKFLEESSLQKEPSTPPRPRSKPKPIAIADIDDHDVIDLDISEPSTPSFPASIAQDYLPDVGQMNIRISFEGTTYKFEGNERWDMGRVRHKLSELTKVPENELLLYTPQNYLKMVDGKTLLDYGIEGGDTLDATRRIVDADNPMFSPVKSSFGKLKLKFQKAGLKKPIFLVVSKFSTLTDIRSQLAKELKVEDDSKLYFHFDGDSVDLTQTPEELELEDNDCIDVFEKM